MTSLGNFGIDRDDMLVGFAEEQSKDNEHILRSLASEKRTWKSLNSETMNEIDFTFTNKLNTGKTLAVLN